MRYAFKVVSKKNAKTSWSEIMFGTFNGGYVGDMLKCATDTARWKGGKLAPSKEGFKVECAGDAGTDEELASRW